MDWNQARENVFPGAAWLSGATGAEVVEQLRQPTALVCSSKTPANVPASGGRQQRDELLISNIRAAINKGGDVLIPCDTSARVLELAFVLDRAWSEDSPTDSQQPLNAAKVFLANSTSSATLRYARSMIEWMDESVVRDFEARAQAKAGLTQVFDFRHIKLVERKSQVDRVLASPGPKVFLASDSSLEWGMARQLLEKFISKPENLIILTDTAESGAASSSTVSAKLLSVLRERSDGQEGLAERVQLNDTTLETKSLHTSPLAGTDLSTYQQFLARQRQRLNTAQVDKTSTLETSVDAVDEASDSSSSSDESDTEHQGKALNVTAALTHSKNKLGLTDEELGINILIRRKNVHDFDVRGKKGRDKVFPFVTKRRRNDDFGDLIRPEEYLRAEERDEVNGEDLAGDALKGNTALGGKRKWGDTDITRPDRRTRNAGGAQKRRKEDGKQDNSHGPNGTEATGEADEDSESDYEPAEAVVREPQKATFRNETLSLNMQLAAVDYSGIHDLRSLQMLIPLIRPRKLILTGGTEAETSALLETCRSLLANPGGEASRAETDDIFAPSVGEVIDASVDTNAWTIRLSQSLFRHLQWQKFRGLGIVTINGRLGLKPPDKEEGQASDAKRQKVSPEQEAPQDKEEESASQSMPILEEMPLNLAVPTRSASHALHVGDLRLAELRKIMQANGHTAEFKGEGTLLVDGIIAVRKSGIGKIEVETGGLSGSGAVLRQPGASFHNVKRKIYEGLAVVAAR